MIAPRRLGSLLLIGGDSEIASVTARYLRDHGHSVIATTRRRACVSATRPWLDLSPPLDNWQPPSGTRAACILAAIARLKDCAEDPEGSRLINVTRAVELTDRLLSRGIPVLFLSSDKVFDGSRPLVPADAAPCPVSEYGRQKEAAEAALRDRMATGAPVAVLRLAKVVSPGMPLLRQWVAAISAGEPVRAFFDMMMAPTPVELVAAAIEGLLVAGGSGIFQLTGPGDVAYSDVAARLLRRLAADPRLLQPISAYAAGAPPGSTAAHTTLDSSALRDRFGIVVPDDGPVIDGLIESCL